MCTCRCRCLLLSVYGEVTVDHHEPNGHNGAAWMDQMASQKRRASGDALRGDASGDAPRVRGLDGPGSAEQSPNTQRAEGKDAHPSPHSSERWWWPFGKDPVKAPVPLTGDYLLHTAWRSFKQVVFIVSVSLVVALFIMLFSL